MGKERCTLFCKPMRSEFPVAPSTRNSDWSVDNRPLSHFFVDDKDDVAFAVDFKHLSPQMDNIEPKQLRAETCGRSSPIGQGCYGAATNWFRQELCPLN